MKIVVHIDRLVLDGVGLEPGGGPRIGATVQRELSRLLGHANGRFAGTALAYVSGPQIAFAPNQSPASIGKRIAASVHAGIARHATEKRS